MSLQNRPEKSEKLELLAPAGSMACLKAACLAGADAIYLSGKRFGARAFASNFDEKSLRWARRVTASLNKKMYVTLNTIVFENEWKLLRETLDFYETLQPDALIIQDLGVARELARRQSRIPRHLSTQGAWWGVAAYEELNELGISRVILPRELSIAEIKEVCEHYPELELEMFVHGAMCYSISGRCYWSIALGTRSGNRGTCAQPCRKEYHACLTQENQSHLFSPKDLRLIRQIPEISDSGIRSLKIEGRMKSPEYVYQVVSAYRKALDNNGVANEKSLDEVYSRASGEGFYNGPTEVEIWRTPETPGREGVVVGQASGESRDGLTGIFACEKLSPGEGIFWYEKGHKKGARLTWVKDDRKVKNLIWVRGISGILKSGTQIRRTSKADENKWESQWNRDWERRPIDLFWSGREGSPLAVEAILNGHPLRIESDEVLKLALQKGLEDGPLQDKFDVLGEFFCAGRHVTTLLGKGLHISASSLKKIKRGLVENLLKFEQLPPPPKNGQSGILAVLPEKKPEDDYSELFDENADPEVYLKVWNHNFPFVRDVGPDCWVLPWGCNSSRIEQIVHARIAYWLPPILNFAQFEQLKAELAEKAEAQTEFFCSGWELFELNRLFSDLTFYADWSFNICNYSALEFLRQKGLKAVFTREWKEEQLPDNLVGFRCSQAWNPLVSFSRFKDATSPGIILQNSHNDHFFSLSLGNGVSGLFLVDKPAAISSKGTSSVMLDVAIGPNENPVQAAKDLNRMIDSIKTGRV